VLSSLLLFASLAHAQPLPILIDDLPRETMTQAVEQSIAWFKGDGAGRSFSAGGRVFTADELADSLELFLSLYKKASSPEELSMQLAKNFEVLRATGLFTGYYEPVLDASLVKTDEYRYPIYGRPADLVEADGDLLHGARGERLWGRVEKGKLVPYFSREQIDFAGALDGKGLEVAWLKSRWDVLDAQIEGSAVLALPDGTERRALFDGTNGLPFKSPARALVEWGLLSKEKWSSQGAQGYLAAHPEDERKVFSADQRYAFFKLVSSEGGGPLGTIRRPLVGGRSIAVDATVYPLGALAWYTVDLPQAGGGAKKAARFALLQDTGGAILGPGRVDVFVGRGKPAFAVAGHLKAQGELLVLVPKKK
jgi:membrane-bound lytic murein transglycosylase A